MEQSLEVEFTAFVAERGQALLRVAQALTGDRVRAEDLVQGALAKAYVRWRLRTVPVAGVPVRQDAWSPDGTLVLLEDQPGQAHPVADVATGRIVTWLPVSNPHFLPSGLILAFSNLEAVLFDTGGNSLAIQGLPYDFTDRQISVGQP